MCSSWVASSLADTGVFSNSCYCNNTRQIAGFIIGEIKILCTCQHPAEKSDSRGICINHEVYLNSRKISEFTDKAKQIQLKSVADDRI
jgi:hypothetical protein